MKSNTDSGVSYTVAAVQDEPGAQLDGDVSLQFPVYDKLGKVTTKLYTSGKGTAEVKLDKLGVKGLTTTLLYGIGKDVGVATVELKHGPIGVTTAYDMYGKAARATVATAYAPKGYAGFFVAGVDGEVGTTEFNADKTDCCISYYDGSESEATVHVTDKGQKGMLSYSHHVRSGFSVAGQFKYDKVKDSAALTFGGAAQLDGVTVVKAKIDSKGLVGLSYIQDIRERTCLILSTKFDVRSLENAKVGISLALD